ncbi:Placenta-specific protein 9 [Plecturocebus cupreus]
MVEKTVEHLATEVKGLLGLLEELAWNLPPGPFSPRPTSSEKVSSAGGRGQPLDCCHLGLGRRDGAGLLHRTGVGWTAGGPQPRDGSGTASPPPPPTHTRSLPPSVRRNSGRAGPSYHLSTPQEEKLPPSLAFSGLKLLSSFHFSLRSHSCSTPKPPQGRRQPTDQAGMELPLALSLTRVSRGLGREETAVQHPSLLTGGRRFLSDGF